MLSARYLYLKVPSRPLLHLKPLSARAANNSVVKKEFSVLKMLVFHIKDEGFSNLAYPRVACSVEGKNLLLGMEVVQISFQIQQFLFEFK